MNERVSIPASQVVEPRASVSERVETSGQLDHLRYGRLRYHRDAIPFLMGMKQTKLVKPKPVSKREVSVDTRTPSGRRTLPY